MTGFEQRSGAATLSASRETSQADRWRNPGMSPPAVNASPAPLSTTKRTVSSRSSSSKTPRSSSRAFIDYALNFPGTSSVIVATPRSAIALDAEAVVLAHLWIPQHAPEDLPRRALRQLGTKRYSRGRLKRASASDSRQKASSSSEVTSPVGDDVRDHALAPAVVGRADDRDLPDPRRPREHVLDLDGVDVLAAEMTMSSTRPTTQRSPSSSIRPTSPVWYQPSRIAFSSASGRFQ